MPGTQAEPCKAEVGIPAQLHPNTHQRSINLEGACALEFRKAGGDSIPSLGSLEYPTAAIENGRSDAFFKGSCMER